MAPFEDRRRPRGCLGWLISSSLLVALVTAVYLLGSDRRSR